MLRTLYTTIGSEEAALRLARGMVEARLVACANMWPIRSVFHWEGDVKDEPEVAIVFKTTEAQVEAAKDHLEALHPYDVPCVEVWPVDAAAGAFEDWVGEEIRPMDAHDVD